MEIGSDEESTESREITFRAEVYLSPDESSQISNPDVKKELDSSTSVAERPLGNGQKSTICQETRLDTNSKSQTGSDVFSSAPKTRWNDEIETIVELGDDGETRRSLKFYDPYDFEYKCCVIL